LKLMLSFSRQIGDADDDEYDMFSHFGAVMFAAISAMFGSAQVLHCNPGKGEGRRVQGFGFKVLTD
jgi:hypothetical protein